MQSFFNFCNQRLKFKINYHLYSMLIYYTNYTKIEYNVLRFIRIYLFIPLCKHNWARYFSMGLSFDLFLFELWIAWQLVPCIPHTTLSVTRKTRHRKANGRVKCPILKLNIQILQICSFKWHYSQQNVTVNDLNEHMN